MSLKSKPKSRSILFTLLLLSLVLGEGRLQAQTPPADEKPALTAGSPIAPPVVVESPTVVTAAQAGAPPSIVLWYGDQQHFGQWGNPQPWANLLGNVSDAAGIALLTYSLNGGPTQPLSLGPDNKRLAQAGDFNIELALADLQPGLNQVQITARNTAGQQTVQNVTVTYHSGNLWPLPFTADWATANNLQSLAQVVDGQWAIQDGVLRPLVFDYDRLVALGDSSWTDYEVTVPVTIHGIDAGGYGAPSNGPGVGLILRWGGHYAVATEQPRTGWQNLGALAWFRWRRSDGVYTSGMQLVGYGNSKLAERSDRTPAFNVPYLFKMRVETVAGGGDTYRFKVWESAQPEPAAWDLVAQGRSGEPQAGSLLLVAHHVDASFGPVTIQPLTSARPRLTVTTTGEGSVQIEPSQPDYAPGQVVTLTARPAAGAQFSGWSGALTGAANPATLVMDGDRTVQATFAPATKGAITIALDAQPDHQRNVSFGGSLGSFKLDDILPDDGDAIGRQRRFVVQPGSYTVQQISSASGWAVGEIVCNAPATVEVDNRRVIIPVNGGDEVSCTFVYQQLAAVRTQVYHDRNGNGVRGSGEPWLAGWTLHLYDSAGTLRGSQTTNLYGKANFNLLRPGPYTVCVQLPAGWVNTQPATVDPRYGQPCYAVAPGVGQAVTVRFGNTTGSVSASDVLAADPVIVPLPDDGAEEDANALFDDADLATPPEQQLFLPLVQR